MSATQPAAPEALEADLQLAKRAARSDPRARRLLANRLVRRVSRIARAMLHGSHESEDAAQTALIEILQSVHTYCGDAPLERWADRITARAVIRYARKERSARERNRDQPKRASPSASAPLSDSANVGHQMQLSAYLAPLSAERREVLVMRHVLEYSVREISDLIGAPTGTVKDRLVAARKQVRSLIQREQDVASGSHVS